MTASATTSPTPCAAIELLVTHDMEAIHRLEATTGQHWYSR